MSVSPAILRLGRADALVRLRFLPPHLHHLVVLRVPPPVPLDQHGRGALQLASDELQEALPALKHTPGRKGQAPHGLHLVIQNDLQVQPGLENREHPPVSAVFDRLWAPAGLESGASSAATSPPR